MINKISIKNFRSISNQEFHNIGDNLVFIGENNSGKSTVLNAIRIFFDKEYIISKNDIKHRSKYFEISICKNFDDIFIRELDAVFRRREHQYFVEFIDQFKSNSQNRKLYTKVYYSEFKMFVTSKYFGGSNLQIMGLQLKVESDVLNKKYTITNSSFKNITGDEISLDDPFIEAFFPSVASIDDERKFFEEVAGDYKSISNSVFNLFIDGLSKGEPDLDDEKIQNKSANELSITELNSLLNNRLNIESNKFLEIVNSTFKNYTTNNLEINWDFNDKLESRIAFKSNFINDSNELIDFMSTGSGTRSIYLISLLQSYMEMSKKTRNKSALFLIEEPELYLYPKLEHDMADILTGISNTSQVFISTHSAALTQRFSKECIYLTEMEEKNNCQVSKYSRLENIDQLVKILGFNSYPFLKKDFVVIVEGPGDIGKYKQAIANLGYDVDKIAFIQLGGVNNVQIALDLQFIQHSELKNKFFIIIDGDGVPKNKIEDKYRGRFNSVSGLTKSEIHNLMRHRFYVTEDSTMLETLTFSIENMNLEGEEFNSRFSMFIQDFDFIEETLVKKLGKSSITQSQKEEIISVLKADDIDHKLKVLKETLIDKELLKKFKHNVCDFKTIEELPIESLGHYIPQLIKKLDYFFKL